MPAYVYIIICGDGTLYTGSTSDLQARLVEHEKGRGARYTRGRGPLRLAYSEEMPTTGDARRREAAIKRLPRRKKLALIAGRPSTDER